MNEDGRIYHEKQLSSLCGQHTLNNLLGAPLYTADTLASIALEMDERERGIMASEGLDTRDMAKFLVLSEALKRAFGLYLVPASKPEVKTKLEKSGYDSEMGFVLNRSNHWFVVRMIRGTFWMIDSMQKHPITLSPFTLTKTLAHHLGPSGSLFVVRGGSLPDSGTIRQAVADAGISENLGEWYDEKELLQLNRGKDGCNHVTFGPGQRLDGHPVRGEGVTGLSGEDEGIARAIALSLEEIEREKFPALNEGPSNSSSMNVARVQIRLPGEKVVRNFNSEDKCSQLWSFVSQKLGDSMNYQKFCLIGPNGSSFKYSEMKDSTFLKEGLGGASVAVRLIGTNQKDALGLH